MIGTDGWLVGGIGAWGRQVKIQRCNSGGAAVHVWRLTLKSLCEGLAQLVPFHAVAPSWLPFGQLLRP